jgi:hypothetical protein
MIRQFPGVIFCGSFLCYNSRSMTTNGQVVKRFITSEVGVGYGVSVVALSLYLSTLGPTVLPADSGEFQFVAWLPGIAHPTGYPLYVLLGWLWTHLLPFEALALYLAIS